MNEDKGTHFAANAGSLNGIFEKIREAAKNEAIIFDLQSERFTLSKHVPERTAALVIGGVTVAHLGNVIGITGQMKSGKTAAITAIAAAALVKEERLGFSVPPTGGVVYIDTEQSQTDTKEKIYNRIVKDVNGGVYDEPNLFVYNLRGVGVGDMLPITEMILEAAKPAIVILDGLSDYVVSVNDEAAGRALIGRLLHLASVYNCLVIGVIHDNHNTEKSRGHLGSELDRKAEAVMMLKKEKTSGVISVTGKFYRSAGNVPEIQFAYSEEQGCFEFLQHVSSDGGACVNVNRAQKLVGLFESIGFGSGLSYTELVAAVANAGGFSQPTAKRKVSEAKADGVVSYANGKYFLTETPF